MKMRVASWHIQFVPYHIPSTFGRICSYLHYKSVGQAAYIETQPKARLPNLVRLPYIMDRPTFGVHTLAIHRMGLGVSLPR